MKMEKSGQMSERRKKYVGTPQGKNDGTEKTEKEETVEEPCPYGG